MRRAVALLLAAFVLALTTPSARAALPANWISVEKISDALAKAAKDDVPVVILYYWSEKFSWEGNADDHQVRRMSLCPMPAGTIRILCPISGMPNECSELDTQVMDSWIGSRLIFTDGEGHIIGVVGERQNQGQMAAIAAQAGSVMSWKKEARKNLEQIDKMACTQLYAKASALLQSTISDDAKWTKAVNSTYQRRPRNAWGGPAERDRNAPRPSEAEQRQMAARDQRMFFYDLEESMLVILKDAADKDLTQLDKWIIEGKIKEARQLIAKFQGVKIDPETEKRIAELRTKLAQAASGKPVAASATKVEPDKSASTAASATTAEPAKTDAANKPAADEKPVDEKKADEKQADEKKPEAGQKPGQEEKAGAAAK